MNTVQKLFDIGGFHKGKFFQKAGGTTSLYVDLRPIVSHPTLLKAISDEMWGVAASLPYQFICGVPYGAFAIASSIAITHKVPMVFRRKEPKNHGLSRMVEGSYEKNAHCIVLEDVVSTGTSVLQAVYDLREAGLIVDHVVTWLNREQGGVENLAKEKITLHSVYTLEQLTQALPLSE